MELIMGIQGVFDFLGNVYTSFPVAVKILINMSFGGILFLAFLKSIKR